MIHASPWRFFLSAAGWSSGVECRRFRWRSWDSQGGNKRHDTLEKHPRDERGLPRENNGYAMRFQWNIRRFRCCLFELERVESKETPLLQPALAQVVLYVLSLPVRSSALSTRHFLFLIWSVIEMKVKGHPTEYEEIWRWLFFVCFDVMLLTVF